jgi:hypothetical protein
LDALGVRQRSQHLSQVELPTHDRGLSQGDVPERSLPTTRDLGHEGILRW